MNLNRVIPFNPLSFSGETFISPTKLKPPENRRLRNQLKRLLVFQTAIRILHNQNSSISELLRQLVSILPGACQYPEICAAHVRIGDVDFVSKDFANTPWVLTAQFDLSNNKHGIVELIYRKKKSFLEQERELIGSFAELLCFALDRRYSQEALREKENALRSSDECIRDLSDRLIHAQETERSRIARNLHDNINQQVAALAISLSSIKKRLNSPESEISQEFTTLQQRIFEIAKEIRNVSHELHPGILERLGLTEALQSQCAEFSNLHSIRAEVRSSGDVDHVPPNVSLCIFRVAQEALHNVASHSAATLVKVRVKAGLKSLDLIIEDNGHGFYLEESRKKGGLGLISLEERVRLLQGKFVINSEIGSGTRLHVSIPLVAANTLEWKKAST